MKLIKSPKKRLLNREEGVSPVLIYVYIFISLVFRLMVSIPYFTEYKSLMINTDTVVLQVMTETNSAI